MESPAKMGTPVVFANTYFNQFIAGHYIMQGDFLLIKNVTEADDGTYYCTVTLSNGDTKLYPIKVIGSSE